MKDKTKSLSKQMQSLKIQRLICYLVLITPAVLQFAIFYVYCNFNTILLAFRDYNFDTGRYFWVGFANFKEVIYNVTHDAIMKYSVLNSLIIWVASFAFFPFSIFTAFYIYKKMPFSNFFLTVSLLPSMVSSLVFSLIFAYFMDQGIPVLWEKLTGHAIKGLLANTKTLRPTLLINSMYGSLCTNLVLNYNAMKSIDDSIVEAAQLDGCTVTKEFFHITIPNIFPTLTIWLTGMVAGLFSIDMGQLAIFGTDASSKIYTFGYYMYRAIKVGTYSTYSKVSALGVLMTSFALPVTLIVRKLLEKYGPGADNRDKKSRRAKA